jgi:hypothetical protein
MSVTVRSVDTLPLASAQNTFTFGDLQTPHWNNDSRPHPGTHILFDYDARTWNVASSLNTMCELSVSSSSNLAIKAAFLTLSSSDSACNNCSL